MIDHVSINVSDYWRSRDFYAAALAPLGYELLMEPAPEIGGFGSRADQKPFFWMSTREPANSAVHIAFGVADRVLVDAFHEAALAAGGTDNGQPGVRSIYHPNYYGAFVHDPDGNNVEAVCHGQAG